MTRKGAIPPVAFVTGLAAIVLFAGPVSISAQGDRDPSAVAQVQIAVTVVEYLETRYGTRASHPDGVGISGLSAQGAVPAVAGPSARGPKPPGYRR
jgi:hypothetical protein